PPPAFNAPAFTAPAFNPPAPEVKEVAKEQPAPPTYPMTQLKPPAPAISATPVIPVPAANEVAPPAAPVQTIVTSVPQPAPAPHQGRHLPHCGCRRLDLRDRAVHAAGSFAHRQEPRLDARHLLVRRSEHAACHVCDSGRAGCR